MVAGAAALVMFVALTVVLRSPLAAVTLLVSLFLVVLGTLGTTALVFQKALGDAGVAFNVPIVLYVFVLAIGTDYALLTLPRIREGRAEGMGVKEATVDAARHATPAVVAAGVILAGTFGSLMLAAIPATVQLGFSVAAGIALACGVVGALFGLAVATSLGDRFWWPGTLRRREDTPATTPRAPEHASRIPERVG
ncbi:hypothetical protein GCM10027418_00360 [Mariniluteicoccus endophyticus]